ncbi:MAG TPA: response regulator, partial [Rhodopila sp.]|nr:response regulator [Rhodopila sp.]
AAAADTAIMGRILVADDNTDMRGYIERLLSNAGFDVQAVANGQAALDAALRQAPDLVLTDVMMPRLDGFGLLTALRSDPRTAHLPVILLSARAGEDARIEGVQAGADDYLVKPFNARELVARVEGAIRLARQRWQADRKVLAQKGILERIAEAAPLDEVLAQIIRFVEQEQPAAHCAIMTLQDNGACIADIHGPGLSAAYPQALSGLSPDAAAATPAGRAARSGHAIVVRNTAVDNPFPAAWRRLMQQNGIRSVLSTPVLGGQETVVGVLDLLFHEQSDPSAADAELADTATKLVAIAMERNAVEATLREREERLRLIIDSAREYAILTTDPQGRITSWNAGAERLLGYAAEEVLGQPTTMFFTPEDRAGQVPARELAQALQEGRADNERWHIRKDGTRFFASGMTLPLANGRGLLAIFRDRTQERQLEEEVQRRNAELRAVLEAVPVAVWFTYDTRAQYATGNRVATELLRLEPGANASETSPIMLRPAHRSFRDGAEADPVDLPLQRAARGESVWNDLLQVRMGDGRMRDLICSAVPLFSPSGGVIGAVCTGTDVTERMAAERKLRDLTETLEQRVVEAIAERNILADIVEGTDALIQVVDIDYRWLAINRACTDEIERSYGLRPRVGESMLELFAGRPTLLSALRALWDRALAGAEFTEVVEVKGAESGTRFYEARFNVLRGQDGAQIGAYHFAHDVTQRVESQTRLAETQAQLHEMQKLETIGQLSGGIAHDFNNLLTPIVTGLDLLRIRHQADERSARLISAAMQSAERARVLVGRLLSFARRQNLETRPVSIPDLVSGMRDLIARSLGPQIAITLDLPDPTLIAEVDPNQLELALLNLCVNARDAMPDGGKLLIASHRVEIAGASVASLAPGSYIRLSVTDTGTGMDKETLRRAVEPFYTTKDVGRGTGLGLSTVHGLALQSGGALVLDSAPGLGTTATIYLPAATAIAATERLAETVTGQEVGPLTILLVDDEELVRSGVSDLLESLGHQVVSAGSAAAALDHLRRRPDIDLLVTDYMMPSMTGLALIMEARQVRPGLPALLVTGYASIDANGTQDIPRLAKPLREGELSAAIWAALNARQKPEDATAPADLPR